MPTAPSHIIRKQRVVAHYRGEQADAFELQRQLTDLLSSSQANQALDTVLSEFSTGDEWVVLDTIEIEVGTLAGDQWETGLLQQIQTALRNKLFDAIPDAVLQGKTIRKTGEQIDFEQLIYFLQQGFFEHIPFHSTPSEKSSVFQAWASALIGKLSTAQVHALTTLLRQHATARHRFLNQVSPESWLLFLQKVIGPYPNTDVLLAAVFSHLTASAPVRRGLIFSRVLDTIAIGQSIDIMGILNHIDSGLTATEVDGPKPEGPPAQMQSFFVQNAGVILLHPFVFTCFDALGWLSKGQFTDETARQKAILMWHYLATGTDRVDEYELTLAKLLSGLPLNAPFLEDNVWLTEAEKEEGETLLRAVVTHWSALKNTSPDGLRAEFLQREGKIEPGPFGGNSLTVEQRASDVLLNSLPWGMSLIKLDWMKDILYVNWA